MNTQNQTTDTRYDLLGRAVSLAVSCHLGQYRIDGKTPFITHPLAVMVAMHGDAEDMTLAVLHDVVEDTGLSLMDVQEIVGLSDEQVYTLDCLSRRDGEPKGSYILRVCTDRRAMRIKLRDIEHNMSTLTPEIEYRRPRYLAQWFFIFVHLQLALKKIQI